MNFLKNLDAYYTGRDTCENIDDLLMTPRIYAFDKEQMDWFISGILNSDYCILLQSFIMIPSMYYCRLIMLNKIFKDAGIKSKISYSEDFKCLIIAYKDLAPFIDILHLTRSKKREILELV